MSLMMMVEPQSYYPVELVERFGRLLLEHDPQIMPSIWNVVRLDNTETLHCLQP